MRPALPTRQQDLVGVEQPEVVGHRVLLLQDEPVGGPPGDHVQGVADVEQGALGVVEPGVRASATQEAATARSTVEVAQPAARLLEVGLEGERDVAGALGPLLGRSEQVGEPLGREPPPVGEDRRAQALAEGDVAGDVPDVEHAEQGPYVVRRHASGLGRRADRVVQADARVPDRVPDPVRELGGLLVPDPGGAEQHDVEVAARGELASAVAADGDERGPEPVPPASSNSPASHASVRSASARRRSGPESPGRASSSVRRSP